ncbi:GNAT family N-acetyltransferase [Rhizobium sp. TRM95111]|uniref:GNAT family N-acetyltransferase n=1 Tax=Rhizobium alarense TaxID=2846851 RepID=UPI001F21050B|nr:GNAT family N-acetyltransferase [Rhizobium alarense]MCF3642376.1 GNAT family N-acetyltransferase [Rhizobium alarense]
MGEPVIVRHALSAEIPVLARLWYDGWQDAHAAIVPAELARRRTLVSFAERLAGMLDDARVAGPPGAPLGLCIIKHEELDQLYVSPAARGTGIAAALVGDAEQRLAARGIERAWLACAIGNARAARFYKKCGWTLAGTVVNRLETIAGPFDLEVWRYEKHLRP